MKPISEMPAPLAGKVSAINGEKVKTTIHIGRTLEVGRENATAIRVQQDLYKARFGKCLTDNEAVMLMVPASVDKYSAIAELMEEISQLILDAE